MQANETINTEELFSFFQRNPEKPWHLQDLQKRLNIKHRTPLRHALKVLVDEGKLIRTRRRSYGLPQEMNLFIGSLQVTSGGYGFVIPDKDSNKEKEDLFIPADRLAGAWNGDRVAARPFSSKTNGKQSGEIIRIIKRNYDELVGTLEYSKGYAILRPDSAKLKERILLLPDSVGNLDAGKRIVVKMHWPEETNEKLPFAEVTDVLGEGDNPEIETKAVIIKYDLKDSFEVKTVEEARAIPPVVTGEMYEGRTNVIKVPTFTIDGEDAKDFDDAISLERLEQKRDGLLRIGIHIADVSYYVAEGTNLDKEALERATSVYLPGKVLPMLPEALSNGICSLVEGEARLSLSVFVDVTRKAEVKNVSFKETVIKSDARLTYEDVRLFAEGDRLPKGKRKLERDIKLLLDLTQRLRKQRFSEGALNFDFTEAKVDLSQEGGLKVNPIRSNVARQLIEELMLLANRLVAQELDQKDIPALFRVHENPSEEKLDVLYKALGRFGYKLDPGKTSARDLQDILKEVRGKPEAELVSNLLLRAMKQARYHAENLGHFGLAFDHYLHFTSPIRRYPDLVVHRVLKSLLQHRLSPTLKERFRSDFPELAEHSSKQERVAEDAERDLTKYYHARWALEHIGETFEAVITGVTNFGIFAALPNGVEGRIHVSQLDDDYYMFIEDAVMLLGKHTRRSFKMGEKLEIRIIASQPVQRQIDLLPAYMTMPELEEEEPAKPVKQPKNLKTPIEAKPEKLEQKAEKKGFKTKSKPPSRAKAKTDKKHKSVVKSKEKKRRKILIFGPK